MSTQGLDSKLPIFSILTIGGGLLKNPMPSRVAENEEGEKGSENPQRSVMCWYRCDEDVKDEAIHGQSQEFNPDKAQNLRSEGCRRRLEYKVPTSQKLNQRSDEEAWKIRGRRTQTESLHQQGQHYEIHRGCQNPNTAAAKQAESFFTESFEWVHELILNQGDGNGQLGSG